MSALLVVAVSALGSLYYYWFRPVVISAERVVSVPKGSSLRAISEILAKEDVIDHPELFLLFTGYLLPDAPLVFQAGEYAFAPGVTPAEVARKMMVGERIRHFLTVPEGLTVAAAARLVMKNERLKGAVTELPPEGGLLPETYDYHRGDDRQAFLMRMVRAMDEKVEEIWALRTEDSPLATPAEMVILASIVQSEARLPSEAPMIAAVYLNRLKRGMKLQADPTVIYGVTDGAKVGNHRLTRSELAHDTPYNTYLHAGLPPTPIANPGEGALRAVAQPAASQALYFVADGTGGHVFAETYEEHRRNVARWRRLEKKSSP